MLLGMKNFNILKVYWKIQLLGGGSCKTTTEGGLSVKGLGQFADLRGGGGLARGGGVFFWGGGGGGGGGDGGGGGGVVVGGG